MPAALHGHIALHCDHQREIVQCEISSFGRTIESLGHGGCFARTRCVVLGFSRGFVGGMSKSLVWMPDTSRYIGTRLERGSIPPSIHNISIGGIELCGVVVFRFRTLRPPFRGSPFVGSPSRTAFARVANRLASVAQTSAGRARDGRAAGHVRVYFGPV